MAELNDSSDPLEDDQENVTPGGAVPFDDDDFTGFDVGSCDSPASRAHVPHARETIISTRIDEGRVGPASGHALLHERPPRHARG